MEVTRSLWIRYGKRIYEGWNMGYSPLSTSPASLSLNSFDRDAQDHATTDGAPKPFERRPIISWRTEPKFEISVNFRGVGRHMIPILLALLPSFVLPSKSKKPRKLFPTSYLDGLRGVAALFVFIHHYAVVFTASSLTGYHLEKGAKGSHDWFFLMPLIRVVHSGRFMVVIFFVISGYVLSYRSLKLARQGKHLELLDSLGSSMFRRWLRLHLPVVASTFLAFMLARWGFWTEMPKGWEHSATGTYIAVQTVPFPRSKGSFTTQLWDWYVDARQLCDPFLYGRPALSRYNVGILWTIPVEWMGSMLVFAVVLGISRTRTWVKLGVLLILIYRTHQTARWAPACFLSGILLAEVSFIYSRPIEPSTTSLDFNEKAVETTRTKRYLSRAYKIFFVLLFITGLYIGSHPQHGWQETPGYRWLFKNLPQSYAKKNDERGSFWPSIGAFFVIFSLEMAPFLQRIFTTSFAQYLGDISFSLYMIHRLVQFTMGQWLVPKCMNLTGGWSNGQTGYIGGMMLAVMVLGPVTFWVSDVFSRCVDEKCVKFARWVGTKCFIKM